MKKLGKQELLSLYRSLVRARKFDELNIRMAAEGKLLTFYHSCQGHEAVGVGACTGLRKDDYWYAHHRGHGLPYAIGKGMNPRECIAEHLGKATGWGGGMTGFHLADPEFGVLGMGGTIGSGFPMSTGFALAAKKRGKGQVALCFSGDGGVQRGQFHESLNLAACWKLPVIFIVENNGMAWFTPACDTMAVEHVATMGGSYNIPSEIVDGADVLAVHYAVQTAVERARKGEGPSLIECKLFRFRSHSEGRPDICHYEARDKEEVAAGRAQRDPVKLFREKLLKEKVLTPELVGKIDEEADDEAVAAEAFALESPYPDPANLPDMVYAS